MKEGQDKVQVATIAAASPIGHPDIEELRAKALALRGKKSMGMIARELGISRNAVAGFFFRESHQGQKSIGVGRWSGAPYAEARLPGGRPRGTPCRQTIRAALEEIIQLCHSGSGPLRKQVLEIAEGALTHADRTRARYREMSARKTERQQQVQP